MKKQTDPPVHLLFCEVSFLDLELFVARACPEIRNPEMAEVMIPYKRQRYNYGITCYLNGLPNAYPAIVEMLVLQANAETLFIKAFNAIFCRVCEDWIARHELKRWTGDDALHHLCPGCDSDLLPVEKMEA